MGADRPVHGVVLAGGDSVRFGDGDKALAELDGRPLLAHVVDTVAATSAEPPLLAVATRREGVRLADVVAETVEPVVDRAAYQGPLAGLVSAAERATYPWLFVCGCDMPLVTGRVIDALWDRVDGDLDAVVPVVDGHEQPLCALYRRGTVEEITPELPETAGLRVLLDEFEAVERVDNRAVDGTLATAVTNVNTQAELLELRDRTGM